MRKSLPGRQSTKKVSNSPRGQANALPKEAREPLPQWWVVCLPDERKSGLGTLGYTNRLLAEENVAGTDHSTSFYMLTTVSVFSVPLVRYNPLWEWRALPTYQDGIQMFHHLPAEFEEQALPALKERGTSFLVANCLSSGI